MSKNQGVIIDVSVSAAFAAINCYILSWVDFHPVFVFAFLLMGRYNKLTLARRVAGLRKYIAAQQEVKEE